MNKIKMIITFLLLLQVLVACSQNKNFDSPLYTGKNLEIGLVGDEPKIREKNINFVPLTMKDIQENNIKGLDAVFITKKYLPEAAEGKYAKVYSESPIPFVFVESEKVYMAYIDENLSYESAHDSPSQDYLIGYHKDMYFGLGLYNDTKTEKSIQDCYSRVFKLVEQAKDFGKIELK